MRIARLRIANFRAIKKAELFPSKHNVFLGPNNTGKTAILEALYLLLNPDLSMRSRVIDENDFYGRCYYITGGTTEMQGSEASGQCAGGSAQQMDALPPIDGLDAQGCEAHVPVISIEAVLSELSTADEDFFRDYLIAWNNESKSVIDATNEGTDPFATGVTAIRVCFEGRYDPDEDDFHWRTFFVTDSRADPSEFPEFGRRHKRHIGFLIYRDFRGLTKPITLEPSPLFGRLLSSQDVVPKRFDDVLSHLSGALAPITSDTEFASIVNAYKAELERFLLLSFVEPSALSFELTDRTRGQVKESAELYVRDECKLPLQKMGAGTRSLAILGILTLIMRRRERGILALEEPETFLFPHAQRRVIDECLDLADQTFVTTHSPYVLERMPSDGVGRLSRASQGTVNWRMLDFSNVKHLNLYSKRIRQSFCEALLGKGVVVVEGDSDRWWIYGTTRIMNRNSWNGRRQEALELQGISVVSTDSNADLGKTGRFFNEAGLTVVCVADQVKDDAVVKELCGSAFSSIFLRQKGLEELLASQLPVAVIREALKAAPHSRVPLPNCPKVDGMDEPSVRAAFQEFMIGNKGSAQLHEWLIAQLDQSTVPKALKDILDIITQLMNGSIGLCHMSML